MSRPFSIYFRQFYIFTGDKDRQVSNFYEALFNDKVVGHLVKDRVEDCWIFYSTSDNERRDLAANKFTSAKTEVFNMLVYEYDLPARVDNPIVDKKNRQYRSNKSAITFAERPNIDGEIAVRFRGHYIGWICRENAGFVFYNYAGNIVGKRSTMRRVKRVATSWILEEENRRDCREYDRRIAMDSISRRRRERKRKYRRSNQ